MRTTKLTEKTKISKNIQDALFSILIISIMIIIITNPKKFGETTINGIKLFFYNVFPGLFPFMFLTKLLSEIGYLYKITNKFDKISYTLFGTSGISLYAFIMSIISGYPIGAKIIEDLYTKNLISETDAKKMSVFCTTSGPIFIIGTIGSFMFNNIKIGIILYISHIFSSLILGVIYHILTKNKNKQYNNKIIFFNKSQNIISISLINTINSLLIVGSYITIFALATEILSYFNFFYVISNLLFGIFKIFNITKSQILSTLYGLLEVTRGAKELSLISVSPLSISLCCFILSFSGISIIMQSMNFLKTAKIKTHNFIFTKVVHSIVSFFLCYLICIVIQI